MQTLTLLFHRYLRWRRNRLFSNLLASAIVVTLLAVALMTLFVYLPIGITAWNIGPVLSGAGIDTSPQTTVQSYVLWAMIALMLPRILLQQGSSSRTLPYRTLPAPVAAVLHTDLGLQIVSLHTLIPISFFVPFWIRYVRPIADTPDAATWLWTAVMLVVTWTYASTTLADRIVRGSRAFWLGTAGIAVLGLLDVWLDLGLVTQISTAFFTWPLAGAGAATLLAASTYTEAYRFRRSASAQIDRGEDHVVPGWLDALLDRVAHHSATGAATSLELRLILRHARTREIVMAVCVVACIVGAVLIFGDGLETNVIIGVQYVTAGFIIYYMPFLFANQHGHLDGVLARPAPAEALVRGKLYAVQITNLALFTLLSPGLLTLPLYDAALIVSWVPYALWVLAPFAVYLSPGTRAPVDISASVFAVQSKVATHLLPMIAPTLGLAIGALVQILVGTWWLIIAAFAVGLAARAFQDEIVRRAADRLQHHRHDLLHNLRTREPS
ncbi:MAG: hypothetical protein GVY25_11125 [Bacteroidetes bacterium]|jgi:hypothetical protein|nr:hypothetical protein [Bacteroidota bacterium]